MEVWQRFFLLFSLSPALNNALLEMLVLKIREQRKKSEGAKSATIVCMMLLEDAPKKKAETISTTIVTILSTFPLCVSWVAAKRKLLNDSSA